jgi:hypothetical protein
MENHPNKILYVGTGCHIEPVTHFLKTKTFVFIDSQPRSEFDSDCPKFNETFYRPDFLNQLIDTCQHYDFEIESCTVLDNNYHKKINYNKWYWLYCFNKPPININPTMLVFFNKKTQQKIIYYVSTNIKFNMNEQLLSDINTCDAIIVSGYFPETQILQYFSSPKIFFGYTNTCYDVKPNPNKEKDNNIIYFLNNCICNTQYFFVDFYIVYEETGIISKCNDFKHFLTCVDTHHYRLTYEDDTESSHS